MDWFVFQEVFSKQNTKLLKSINNNFDRFVSNQSMSWLNSKKENKPETFFEPPQHDQILLLIQISSPSTFKPIKVNNWGCWKRMVWNDIFSFQFSSFYHCFFLRFPPIVRIEHNFSFHQCERVQSWNIYESKILSYMFLNIFVFLKILCHVFRTPVHLQSVIWLLVVLMAGPRFGSILTRMKISPFFFQY